MKIEDIPCPPPPGFNSGEYSKASNDATTAVDPYRAPWGKGGGHLKNATDEFFDSVWGVPVGRRGGKY